MSKSKYYSTKQIDDTKAEYRFILGERSNGKSYALKVKDLELGNDYVYTDTDEVQGI